MIEDIILESETNVLLEMANCYYKQLIIEEASDVPVKTIDSVSKWKQFVNWVSRCIKTILARISRIRLNKHVEIFKHKELDDKNYRIDSSIIQTLDTLIGVNGRSNVDAYGKPYQFKKLSFDKSEVNKYKQHVEYLMNHPFKPVKHTGDTKVLNMDEVRKYINGVSKNSQDLSDRLIAIQDHINATKEDLSEDDRQSEAFQQYVQMLTLELSNDLKVIQFINKFFDVVTLFAKDKDDEEDVEVVEDNETDEKESDNGETSDDSPNEAKSENDFPPKVKYVIKQKLVKDACHKFVFKKHPRCKAIYGKLQPDGDTLLIQYDLEEGSEDDFREYRFSVNEYRHKIPWSTILSFMNMDEIMKQLKGGIVIKR